MSTTTQTNKSRRSISGYGKEAQRVRRVGHLSESDISRATGAGESTVRSWLRGAKSPTGERAERLGELGALIERLPSVMDSDYIPVWLKKPIPALDDKKPIDVICDGGYRQVSKIISALEDPPAL